MREIPGPNSHGYDSESYQALKFPSTFQSPPPSLGHLGTVYTLFLTQTDLCKQEHRVSFQALISKEKTEGLIASALVLTLPRGGERAGMANNDLIPFLQDFLGPAGPHSSAIPL